MEIKVYNKEKSVIALLIGILIGLICYGLEFIRIIEIDEIGVISKIQIYNAPDSDIRDYYFLTNEDKKIWISQNGNTKMKKIETVVHRNKMIKYDPANPENYIFTDINQKALSPTFLYYFVGIPIIFYAFFMVLFPNRFFYKIYHRLQSSYVDYKTTKSF